MKDYVRPPVLLFLDDWPQPPKCAEGDEIEGPGLTEVKKWRMQTLLAENSLGIPLLAFGDAYRRKFGKELDVKELGFEHLFELVSSLPDVFTVQEPDEVTALLFPDYPQGKILHDARIGHVFDSSDADFEGPLDAKKDPEAIVSYAWLNRDDDMPTDVVLPGEQYFEIILPMTSANIPGTRGIHRATLIGAATPNYFYINIKNDYLKRTARLTEDIYQYFKECNQPIEMYSVPEEFIYPGFPCLVYIEEEQTWERCAILGRKVKGGKVHVETVDFGGSRLVNPIYLCLMPRKFFDIPKQGVLVSMIGLKPYDGTEKWSSGAGFRMRCFSNCNYLLDCLLLQPKERRQQPIADQQKESSSIMGSSSFSSDVDAEQENTTINTINKIKNCTIKDRTKKSPLFEVLVCDRNDDEMDLYLDEILIMESYAISDEKRSADVKTLRRQLNEALKTIPRPVNPLN